jgi:PAS domain S-box-containing protein
MNPREQIINEIVEKGVFEAIGDGISIQDTNFKILYQNNIHKKIIGNHLGEYCYNAYEKNEKVCTGCPLADTFKDGEIHTKERSAPTDKGTIYVEITSSPIKVPSGEIIAGIEVVRDITERKRITEELRESEKSLRESEAKYRLLFDNMLNGFAYHKVLYDEGNKPIDYIFLVVNDAFEGLTGLKRKDVIGKMVSEVIPGIKNADTDLISIYGEVALTGQSKIFELYFEPFDKWYLVSAYSHQKGYFAAIFDDITNQKKIEKDLRARIEELETFYQVSINRELKMKNSLLSKHS